MKRGMRALSLIAAVTVTASLFAGCGQKETASDGATKIVWWDNGSSAKKFTEQSVKDFNETIGKEKNIYIDYQFKEDAGNQMSVALSSGGDIPDFLTGNLVEMADKGQIAALDDMPGGEEFLKKYDFYREKTNGYKGKTYTVPTTAQLYGVIYNKDMFKAAGIVDENGNAKPPETWDELREDAKILTNKDKKEFGIVFPIKWGGWFGFDIERSFMAATGQNDGYDPAKGTFDYTQYAPMLEAIVGIRDDGSCYPGAENVDNDPARARFAEGNIGMKLAVTWDVGVLNDQFPAKCDWGVAPLPSIEKDKKFYQRMDYGYAPFISAQAAKDHPEAVMAVYEWMNSEELDIEKYKNGVAMPWNPSVIDGVTLDNPKTGWQDFGEILKVSKMPPMSVFTDTTKYTALSKDFIDNVWSGKTKTVEQCLADWTKIKNDGIAEYKKNNPDYDSSEAIDKTFDARR